MASQVPKCTKGVILPVRHNQGEIAINSKTDKVYVATINVD